MNAAKQVLVNEVTYTQRQCYITALTHDPECSAAWFNLGASMSATEQVQVNGANYTKRQCFIEALSSRKRHRERTEVSQEALDEDGAFAGACRRSALPDAQNLPCDVVCSILEFLPEAEVIRARLVSRSWLPAVASFVEYWYGSGTGARSGVTLMGGVWKPVKVKQLRLVLIILDHATSTFQEGIHTVKIKECEVSEETETEALQTPLNTKYLVFDLCPEHSTSSEILCDVQKKKKLLLTTKGKKNCLETGNAVRTVSLNIRTTLTRSNAFQFLV
jgi:predicted transcriptional regulator